MRCCSPGLRNLHVSLITLSVDLPPLRSSPICFRAHLKRLRAYDSCETGTLNPKPRNLPSQVEEQRRLGLSEHADTASTMSSGFAIMQSSNVHRRLKLTRLWTFIGNPSLSNLRRVVCLLLCSLPAGRIPNRMPNAIRDCNRR